MKYVLTYNSVTGEILQTSTGALLDGEKRYAETIPNGVALQVEHSNLDGTVHYIDSGIVKDKMAFPRLIITAGKISNIPPKTTVIWPDNVVTEESGELEFEFNISGVFNFIFRNPRYLEHEKSVTYNV